MGRLFWKFFFIFWLAQVLTSVGVGFAIWVDRLEPNPEYRVFDRRPPPHILERHGQERPPHRADADLPRPHPPAPPLLPILSGSVVSVVFAALLAWYFAKPIRILRTGFEAVASGRLQTRIGPAMGNRKDEFADLGSDFDSMASRLENLLEAQRRLLHDVSHELRSPLARLQAAVGLVRQQPERAAEFIERIERDTGRMDKLVGELLTLARLDSGMAGNFQERVDIRDVLADITYDAQFEAQRKQCSLDLKMTDVLNTQGSHELLYRAVENIVRNAILYSPEGAHISISAHATADRLSLLIADTGPGVPECDLAAIFEPFFRIASNQSPVGYGLGLAITRRVIEAHGGSVVASNRPEGGLAVLVELPKL